MTNLTEILCFSSVQIAVIALIWIRTRVWWGTHLLCVRRTFTGTRSSATLSSFRAWCWWASCRSWSTKYPPSIRWRPNRFRCWFVATLIHYPTRVSIHFYFLCLFWMENTFEQSCSWMNHYCLRSLCKTFQIHSSVVCWWWFLFFQAYLNTCQKALSLRTIRTWRAFATTIAFIGCRRTRRTRTITRTLFGWIVPLIPVTYPTPTTRKWRKSLTQLKLTML